MKFSQKIFFLTLSLLFFSFSQIYSMPAKEEPITYGVINPSTCISESKYGKQEQEAFDQLHNQIASLVADKEKQLTDITDKLNNPEFVDSLSPEAEQEMKSSQQSLYEEIAYSKNQYSQILQQAQMKMYHLIGGYIQKASEVIAKKKNIPIMLNSDVVFYALPQFDVTTLIIEEMDKNFAKEKAEQKTAAPLNEKDKR
jgi:outer membrane protein